MDHAKAIFVPPGIALQRLAVNWDYPAVGVQNSRQQPQAGGQELQFAVFGIQVGVFDRSLNRSACRTEVTPAWEET
jgi:hypothetical protein